MRRSSLLFIIPLVLVVSAVGIVAYLLTQGLQLEQLIETVGYIGLFAIVFAESGLFFGFFFPGDSLLLTAGLLSSRQVPRMLRFIGTRLSWTALCRPDLICPTYLSWCAQPSCQQSPPFALLYDQPYLNIYILLPLLFVAAVLGDTVGYWFGVKTGPLLFKREDSLFFKRRHLLKAQAFYEKHGGKTITLARFLPIIRTFAPIVAGAAEMKYRRFALFNVLGGFVWAIGVTLLGYVLGRLFGSIEGVDRYFTLLVLAFFFIPGLPTLIHLWRENREKIFGLARRLLRREKASASELEE